MQNCFHPDKFFLKFKLHNKENEALEIYSIKFHHSLRKCPSNEILYFVIAILKGYHLTRFPFISFEMFLNTDGLVSKSAIYVLAKVQIFPWQPNKRCERIRTESTFLR